MKNIFSSPPDLQNISHNVEIILNEQRHQRGDMATINRKLQKLLNILLEQQTMDFYKTSPQTESDTDD